MSNIDNSIYKSPLRNLNAKKLLELKNFMNFEEYLEHNFTHFYKTKHDLYIVATNDTPIFSYIDIVAYDIFNAIKIWVDKLIIEPNIKNIRFNQLLNNYVIIYGEYNFLKEKQRELLLIFNKIMIPIYKNDYLHFNYNNSYILYPNFYETNWRPINNDEYNQIIETLTFFIFDILVILYPTQWSYLENDFLYNYIYRDINNKLYIVNNLQSISRKNIIKTYLYQTWLILMHSDNINNFFNTNNSTSSIPFPEFNLGNNNKYWTSNRHTIVKFLNNYINKNYIINYEDYKKINILNDVKKLFFFNYNIYNHNNSNEINITIIIFFIIFIIICISILLWLYYRKKVNNKNPFRFLM